MSRADFANGLTNANDGTVQWTGQFMDELYAHMDLIRSGSQVKEFCQLYPNTPERGDREILKGEILFTLRNGFPYMRNANSISQQPYVASSLNGLLFPRDLAQKLGMVDAADKNAAIPEQMIAMALFKMIRPVGVAMKPMSWPTASSPKDPPIIFTKGPVTMTHTGFDRINICDWVCAAAPSPGPKGAPRILDSRHGLSRTKRALVPAPYTKRGRVAIRSLRLAYKTDDASWKGTGKEPVKIFDEDQDYLAVCLLKFAQYIAFCCTLNETGSNQLEAMKTVGLDRDAIATVTIKTIGTASFSVPMDRYLAAMMTREVKFDDGVQQRVANITENLLGALACAYAEDKALVIGRAMRSSDPGQDLDLDLSQPSL